MQSPLEEQLKNLNHSPASEPDPRWVMSLRSKLEWTMARGTMPALPPLRQSGVRAWFTRPFAIASASFALLLLMGGGITYAAQDTVPGNPLYPVKLASEELRLKLAANDTARTKVELELASRRVEEFRVLSSQHTVTPETASALSTRYEAHVSAALTALPLLPQDIQQSLGDAISNSVDAHIEITAEIEQEDNDADEEDKEEGARTHEEIRNELKQRREEIRKQLERLREFARQSKETTKLLKETSKSEDVKVEIKVETDEKGRARVKIEAERKKNVKKQKGKIEFTSPTTTTDLDLFEDGLKDGDDNDDDARATTTIFFSTPTTTFSPLRRESTRGGIQLNIRSESSGSGSLEQNIKTEIKSESKMEVP